VDHAEISRRAKQALLTMAQNYWIFKVDLPHDMVEAIIQFNEMFHRYQID